ncbi:MAG TPA: FkbM family methyltransferase [Patescibacteria group bacterium]|nr:FkbM family methyltransferase [Patescibacteria group bacterium]
MRINTETFYYQLIKALKPEVVCDIGSLNGYHALQCRKLLPNARILAFEAHPLHALLMMKDKQLKRKSITVLKKAVSNKNGMLHFYLEKVSQKKGEDCRRGISSLRQRIKDSLSTKRIKVQAIRLDTFLKSRIETADTLALWIDVEGNSYEVLKGVKQIREQVCVIHAEVEVQPIWKDQKVEADVQRLMREMNFIELAKGFNDPQHDLVFINSLCWKKYPFKICTAAFTAIAISLYSYLGLLQGFLSAKIKS